METFFSLRLAFLATLLGFVTTADFVNQETLDNIAANLAIRYDVLDNMQNSWRNYRVRLTLKNAGSIPIRGGAWAIFLCHIRVIEPDHTKHNDAGYTIPGSGLRVYHVNGCQHKLEPTPDFMELAAGQARQLEFNAENWAVARTDVMPNWYVAARALQARTIISTSGEELSFVGAFNNPNKWKRFGPDRFNPYTPQQRYKISDVTDLNRPGQLVVPSPSEISGYDEARFVDLGTGDWTIHAADALVREARFLSHKLGLKMVNAKSSFRQIHMNIGDVIIKGIKSTSSEAYSLKINPQSQSVTIVGQSVKGAFYGIQSLLSIADPDNKASQVTINDAPRYEYRGMEVDVGRNFMPKEEITKLIDAMAMYKLNKLHLHLTDDEGWRLEIPGLSELTEMASRRCHDPEEESCIDSQLGSGPGTGNSGTGYYTVDEYKDILRYARDRKVEVIPEFDMPGHGHAAIKAMQLRHKRLAGQGKIWQAQRFLLSDPQDESQYLSVQFFKDNAINPCFESTYEFVEHIVNQVRQMHLEIQPLKVFHFGGDEVAHGAWTKSPACKNLARRLGLNFTSSGIVKDLKEYFVRRVANITSRYCLDLGAWEDGVLGVGDTPYDRSYLKNKNVLAYAWDNVWEWGQGNRAYKLANAGYKVVMTQATHLYFDHPYEPDPEERGYYWAPRFIDTRKTFGFMPDDLYANADFTRMGDPIVDLCENMYKGKCVPLKAPENIAGMAGALWSETVRTPAQFQSMVYPRLLALAERAWHKGCFEDEPNRARRERLANMEWELFANTLGYKELARLDRMNVAYHIPVVGARVQNGTLEGKSAFPGLPIQFSTNDGKTWCDLGDSTPVTGTVKLGTRSSDRRRLSRLIDVQV